MLVEIEQNTGKDYFVYYLKTFNLSEKNASWHSLLEKKKNSPPVFDYSIYTYNKDTYRTFNGFDPYCPIIAMT